MRGERNEGTNDAHGAGTLLDDARVQGGVVGAAVVALVLEQRREGHGREGGHGRVAGEAIERAVVVVGWRAHGSGQQSHSLRNTPSQIPSFALRFEQKGEIGFSSFHLYHRRRRFVPTKGTVPSRSIRLTTPG